MKLYFTDSLGQIRVIVESILCHGPHRRLGNDPCAAVLASVEHQLADHGEVFRRTEHAAPRRAELPPVVAVPAVVGVEVRQHPPDHIRSVVLQQT